MQSRIHSKLVAHKPMLETLVIVACEPALETQQQTRSSRLESEQDRANSRLRSE